METGKDNLLPLEHGSCEALGGRACTLSNENERPSIQESSGLLVVQLPEVPSPSTDSVSDAVRSSYECQLAKTFDLTSSSFS